MSTCAVRIALLVLVFLPAVSLAENISEPVLPENGFEAGWSRDDKTRHFLKNDLYGHIDGGAELFLEFGFEKLLVQKYKNGTDEIDLEIYIMNEPGAALGIYLMKCGRETPLENIPARHTGNIYQITAVKNKFFIQVNSFSGNEKYLPVMSHLAKIILAEIPEAEPLGLFEILPGENLIEGTEILLRGQYALQPLFTFGAGDIFQLKGKIFAVAGDYRLDNTETYTVIMIPYPDKTTAASAYKYVIENFDTYLDITDKLKNRFIFKDYSDRFGDIELKDNLLKVRFNLPEKPGIN